MGTTGAVFSELRPFPMLEKPSTHRASLEKAVDFAKELAVIVARNERGDVQTFPTVEMVFHPELNLV